MGGILRGEGGTLLEIGGMPDHVHVLARLKPTIAVSDMLRMLKANSSKWANDEKMGLRKLPVGSRPRLNDAARLRAGNLLPTRCHARETVVQLNRCAVV